MTSDLTNLADNFLTINWQMFYYLNHSTMFFTIIFHCLLVPPLFPLLFLVCFHFCLLIHSSVLLWFLASSFRTSQVSIAHLRLCYSQLGEPTISASSLHSYVGLCAPRPSSMFFSLIFLSPSSTVNIEPVCKYVKMCCFWKWMCSWK